MYTMGLGGGGGGDMLSFSFDISGTFQLSKYFGIRIAAK